MAKQVYYKAKALLTENERIFYEMLTQFISLEHHIILFKVRMEDVVKVDYTLKNSNYSAYQSYRAKMRNRHFDFVICDRKTQEIQRVIELDGWTHRKEAEKEADAFKDAACAEAGIKLVRIDYNDMNYFDVVLKKITS